MAPIRLDRALLAWWGLAPLLLGSCTGKLSGTPLPNLLPTVELTAAPADTSALYFYRYRLQWSSFDPDGSVDHFVYAVDAPATLDAETTWVSTDQNHIDLEFPSGTPIPNDPYGVATSPHTFVIAAVDNQGAMGPRVDRSFFSYTQAPTVRVTDPRPSNLTSATVTTSARVSWTGTDPDGVGDKKVRFKYLLLGPSSPYPTSQFLSDPTNIPKVFAPEFPATDGWVDVGDTTSILLTNLTPSAQYVFIVVAFDEAGAYSPVFSLESNIIRLRATLAGSHGPQITLFGDYFSYTYSSGGYRTEEAFWLKLEIPIDTQLRVNWSAETPDGSHVVSYRWSVDNQDLSDDTERSDESTDLAHWSAPSLAATSVVLGPFSGETQDHYLFVEALDDLGLRSLGIVQLTVARGTFEKDLLIVDDTRRTPDGILSSGEPEKPIGPWPTAAELDTFLYARGGVPWRNYPAGTRSPQGVFWGYPFDTIGTRLGRPNLNIPLVILGQYKNVVWLVDGKGATFLRSGQDWQQPQTSLYYMNSDNRVNTLGGYLTQGGNLWMMGGGVAMAGARPDNITSNDRPTTTFSSSSGEIRPGRFLYQLPAWRSEVRVASANAQILRHTGRLEGTGSIYDGLPARIEVKATATDPIAIYAPGRKTTDYFLTSNDLEFLQKPNHVLTDDPPEFATSMLDTIYHAESSSLPADDVNPHNVVMTTYRPTPDQTVVFTGFAPWAFRRAQFLPLIDLVLGRMWGLPKTGTSASRVTLPAAKATVRATPDGSRPTPTGDRRLAAPDRARAATDASRR